MLYEVITDAIGCFLLSWKCTVVNVYAGSIDIFRTVGCKPIHCIGNFLRIGKPACVDSALYRFFSWLRYDLKHIGFNWTGRYSIHNNTFWSKSYNFV